MYRYTYPQSWSRSPLGTLGSLDPNPRIVVCILVDRRTLPTFDGSQNPSQAVRSQTHKSIDNSCFPPPSIHILFFSGNTSYYFLLAVFTHILLGCNSQASTTQHSTVQYSTERTETCTPARPHARTHARSHIYPSLRRSTDPAIIYLSTYCCSPLLFNGIPPTPCPPAPRLSALLCFLVLLYYTEQTIFIHHQQNGRIHTRPDLRNHVRDHLSVRPPSPARRSDESSPQCFSQIDRSLVRYSDLQPVGMGAFGLVWYAATHLNSQLQSHVIIQ